MSSARIAVFMLYRQRLPAAAPQSVQWLSTAHALARAGAAVSLLADPPLVPWPGRLAEMGVLDDYGLTPEAHLSLHWLRLPGRTLRGLEFRTRLLAFWVAHRRETPIFYSRSLQYSLQWLRLKSMLGLPGLLVHEWHYSSLANAQEAGLVQQTAALERLETAVAVGAHGHVTVSSGMAAFLNERYRLEGPCFVLPNGGPPAHPEPVAPADPPRVVYAGLFRRPADLEPVLELATRLPEGVPLWVLGGDEEGRRLREVRASAERRGLGGRIVFTGALSPAQARVIVASATVALATFSDSINLQRFACPLKILEYQALGVPLVATDLPTVRALITDGVDGLLATPPMLPQLILRLLEDSALRQRLRAGGLETAARRTWEQRGARLLELLQSLVPEGRNPSSASGLLSGRDMPPSRPLS